MKLNIYYILISIYLVALFKLTHQQNALNEYPKLLYMVPNNYKSSQQLNERSALSNKLKTGWILKSNEKIDLLLYILVQDKLTNLDQIEYGFIHFTTDEYVCNNFTLNFNSNNSELGIFKLNFNQERSKLYNSDLNKQLSIRKARKLQISPLSITKNDQFFQNTVETTLLVAEVSVLLKHSSKKYYSCLSVSKKFSDSLPSQKILRFNHQGQNNINTQIITTEEFLPIYVVVVFYFLLLCFSALFSGLNLGLMSLDLTELNILKKIGNKNEKKYASKIYPLRKRGNLLLCTILLGNVLVNSTSTLILGSYLEGIFAAIGSTLLIVIFGEIIPQAACSRHGLAVGAYTRFITYSMVFLTFPVSFPLSKVLDYFLGKEIATTYTRDIVRELMRQAKDEKGIEEKQFKLISGALDFKHKVVKDIMVPLNDVFSLDINSILDFETFKIILHEGYSRIPVFEQTKENFVGMILIQDLLLNDPADKVPLRAVMEYYKHKVPKCKLQDSLEIMFDKFRKGDSHMAFVYNDDANLDSSNDHIVEAVGIVTFENIIEELVQSEIKDEADTKREKRKRKNKELLKGKLGNVSLSNENLNIFVTEEDQTNKPIISPQIRKALFYFLASSVRPFTGEFITPKLLEIFLRKPEFTIEKRNLSGNDEYLYQYGVEADYFIIILDGNATVQVGRESLEVNAGLFSYYGVNALITDDEKDPLECIGNDSRRKPYKPEFSLKVGSYCVCLKITRKDWKEAVTKSMMERMYSAMQNNSNKHLKTTEENNNNSIVEDKNLKKDSQVILNIIT